MRTQRLEACSYCYFLVRCDGHIEPPTEYHGSNAAEYFLEALQEKEHKLNGVLTMRMTQEDRQAHIDSTQFLLASLDKLVAASQSDAFKITAQYEPTTRERRELLMCKGIYIYSWECFAETNLPTKEAFQSKLSNAHTSHEDYIHAQKVWETIGCLSMGDYHDLCNSTDMLLLADVFGTFWKTC